jgi:N-acetylglutamate synthase-like GNAT family acetyltransferase
MKFTLRSATQGDHGKIRQLIRRVKINPMGLDWRRFTVAVTPTGELVGCGQVKIHNDGSRELASIAVVEDFRNQGIATTIIDFLINVTPKPIYLTCRSSLETFYQRFNFETIQENEMPPYFKRINRLSKVFLKLTRRPERLLVMRQQP